MASNRHLVLSVTQKIVEQEQLQLKVSHAQVQQGLASAGLPEGTKLSRRKGIGIRWTCRTPKGTEFQILQLDTHAVWVQHQTEEDAKVLLWCWENRGASFEVLSVDPVRLETGGGGSKPIAPMDDCPF